MLQKAPRSTLKALMKKRGNVPVDTAAAAMVELSVLLFLHSLAEEARTEAFHNKTATIKAQHLVAVSKKILRRVRG